MQVVKPAIFVLIRIPKTGSTTLETMVRESLPAAADFPVPHVPAAYDESQPLIERVRATRSRVRTLLRRYRTPSMARAWQRIDARARDGDIVHGHIRFGDAALPSFRLHCVTLLREPLARALSEYNYTRMGYLRRNCLRKSYIRGRVQAAGKYSFSGYLAYLDESTNGNANPMSSFALGPRPVADPLAFVQANYFHIGVLEHIEQFAAEFSAKLGVAVRPRKTNVTKRREAQSLSSSDRPVFERIYGRDIALYEAVLGHLQAADRA